VSADIRHLTSAGRLLQFSDAPNVYSVNAYQSLVLASASEAAARLLAQRTERNLNELRAWEPCCGGGPVAVTLKSLGLGHVRASDISTDALAACAGNAASNGLVLDELKIASLLMDGETDRYDLICCNPPCGATSVVGGQGSANPERAIDGGEDGMTLTLDLLEQAKSRLSSRGSLVFIAVSTGALAELVAALDRLFPKRWRVLPASPVVAPWALETDERARALLSDARDFTPFVWRRGDGWVWRYSWVIEASMMPAAFPQAAGLPIHPYGYDVNNDPVLKHQIEASSRDGFWLDLPF
jgi:hypothetical protein